MNINIYYLTAVLSYFIGSIPTGYWYAKYFYKIDITRQGSLNIGSTNCARVLGGFKHFIIITLLDAFKSFFILYLLQQYSPKDISLLILSASFLLIGNSFSLFLYGKGGKGVATFLGITAALQPSISLTALPLWIAIKTYSKSSAAASICMICFIPFYYYYNNSTPDNLLALFFASAAFWIILRHRSNFYTYLKTR
ncbi:hypothetical protein COB28_02745 [Candidatus Dependentiae bacterium]|nr:MAG: hypothetical protein COB28_02745 [Candidatus Dependentiae bacterium]